MPTADYSFYMALSHGYPVLAIYFLILMLPVKFILLATFPKLFDQSKITGVKSTLIFCIVGAVSSYLVQILIYGQSNSEAIDLSLPMPAFFVGSCFLDLLLLRLGIGWKSIPSIIFSVLVNVLMLGYGFICSLTACSVPLAQGAEFLTLLCCLSLFSCLKIYPSWRYMMELCGVSAIAALITNVVFSSTQQYTQGTYGYDCTFFPQAVSIAAISASLFGLLLLKAKSRNNLTINFISVMVLITSGLLMPWANRTWSFDLWCGGGAIAIVGCCFSLILGLPWFVCVRNSALLLMLSYVLPGFSDNVTALPFPNPIVWSQFHSVTDISKLFGAQYLTLLFIGMPPISTLAILFSFYFGGVEAFLLLLGLFLFSQTFKLALINARGLIENGKFTEAQLIVERALNFQQFVFWKHGTSVAQMQLALADAFYLQGNVGQAEAVYWKAISLLAHNQQNCFLPAIIPSLENLNKLLQSKRDFEKSEKIQNWIKLSSELTYFVGANSYCLNLARVNSSFDPAVLVSKGSVEEPGRNLLSALRWAKLAVICFIPAALVVSEFTYFASNLPQLSAISTPLRKASSTVLVNSNSSSSKAIMADRLSSEGMILVSKGELESAVVPLTKAYDLLKSGNLNDWSFALRTLGDVYYYNKNYELAAEKYQILLDGMRDENSKKATTHHSYTEEGLNSVRMLIAICYQKAGMKKQSDEIIAKVGDTTKFSEEVLWGRTMTHYYLRKLGRH